MSKLHNLKIMDMLHVAKQHIQYPKLRLANPNNLNDKKVLQLQLAGGKSQYPGSINITDGKPFGNNRWYGRILRSGEFEFGFKATTDEMTFIQKELKTFADNPQDYAKLYGKDTGNCMFCGKHLTDPQSIAVGYGPICADHYGLPHGEMDKQVASDLSQIEFDLPSIPKYICPWNNSTECELNTPCKECPEFQELHMESL